MHTRNPLLKLSITALATLALGTSALAADKLKIGLMLPASGTFADLGKAITNGFKLAISEQGGTVAGRDIEYVSVDDESDPSKATDNANKLIKRDNVDLMVGTVHSGVALAMARAAKGGSTISSSLGINSKGHRAAAKDSGARLRPACKRARTASRSKPPVRP